MTRLYVALDTQQNRVVIRHLTEESARRWRNRRQFYRTAEIMQKLQHPNIIRFIRVGRQNRLPFMVLEYVESRTLRDLILYRDPLLTQNVLKLMRQMCAALYYIHSHNFIHLDFKPENILVRPDGHLLVIDFDLAQKRKNHPVRIRQLPGTPSYIAPETLTRHVVDERADIYSLGVAFYEMLTFHKPFEGDKLDQVRMAQVDPNVPPTKPKQYNPNVPVALESLVMKCIAKNPADRYPSMSLVIRDLEAII